MGDSIALNEYRDDILSSIEKAATRISNLLSTQDIKDADVERDLLKKKIKLDTMYDEVANLLDEIRVA